MFTGVLFALLIAATVRAQETSNPALSTGEKIYVHLDKAAYQPGETIWFKAYLYKDGLPFLGGGHYLFQLLHPNGDLLQQQLLPVIGTTVIGNFQLAPDLPPSGYLIRAFAPSRINADASSHFYQWLSVGMQQKQNNSSELPGVRIGVEGGKLLSGFKSVVALHTNDPNAKADGYLRSERGDTLARFETINGFGKMEFKPYVGLRYFIEARVNNGRTTVYPLPAVWNSGIAMSVEQDKNGKMVYLKRGDLQKNKWENVQLVGWMDGRKVVHQAIHFPEKVDAVHTLVPTSLLPFGFLHLFVVNAHDSVLSARVCYIESRLLQPELLIHEKATAARKLNRFELKFADSLTKTVSVSVTDADGPQLPSNIFLELFLKKELQEFPAQLQTALTNSVTTVDDVLIAARSAYPRQKQNATAKEHHSSNLRITGSLIHPDSKKPAQGGHLELLLMTDDGPLPVQVAVNDSGNFVCDSLIFFGDAKVFYTYKNRQGKTRGVKLLLDKPPYSDPVILPLPEEVRSANLLLAPVTDGGKTVGRDTTLSKMMEVVRVRAKYQPTPTELLNEKYSSPRFKFTGRVLLDNVNDPTTYSSLNIFQLIVNRVPKLKVRGDPKLRQQVLVNTHLFDLMTGKEWPVQLFINEFPAEFEQVEALRIEDVALIKFHDLEFAAGAITIYIKKGVDQARPPDKLTPSFQVSGYARAANYEHMDYSDESQPKAGQDARTTLFWEPRVFMNEQVRTYSFQFYNSDVVRRFRVRVEGIDNRGNFIYFEKLVE